MVPEGWEKRLLDDSAKRRSGHTPNKKIPEYWNGGIKWVSLADSSALDDGYICNTDKEISAEGLRNSSAVMLPAETVILSRDAGVGKSAVLGEDMAVSQHFIAWTCDEQSKLNNWFLYNWMQRKKPLFERMAVGSTIKTIGLPFFKKLKINVPPLPEQRKIADILSTWDQAIEKTEALLSNASTQKHALMQQLLTGKRRFPAFEGQLWKEVRLGDVATIKGGGTPSKSNPSFWQGDLPWVSVKDLKSNVLQNTIEHITEEGLNQSASNAFDAGTIIVATRMAVGATVKLGRRMAINQDLKAILPTDAIANDFLYYHLKMSEAKLSALGTGSTVKGIVLDDLKRLPIYLPKSLGEQTAIAKILDDAADGVAALTNNIAKLRTEKKALMQQLLTGKRRVKVEDHHAV